MTKLQRNAQIEYRISTLAEAEGKDGPDFYEHYNDLRAAVEQELDAEARGESQTYALVVAVFAWGYGATAASEGYEGCRRHEVTAATERWAGVKAITEHQQQCLGR